MRYPTNNQKESKCKKIITLFLIIIFFIGLAYSVANITLCKLDTKKTEKLAIINQSVKTVDSSVDFEKLKGANNETQGWIQVKGTNIDYAFVQHSDNEYYLTHSFDQSSNRAGWIFMDYRNNLDHLSKNTILYGHGFYKNIMFGTLKNVLKKGWYSNSDNQIITIKTEEETIYWQVFSAYRVKNTSDYIKTSFAKNKDYQSFLNLIADRSFVKFDARPTIKDKILTLSTCYNHSERLVVHAKLMRTDTK